MNTTDTQTAETKAVVLQFGQLLATRNPDVVNIFADEVDWYIQGNQAVAPWLGRRTTKAEVGEFFEMLWAETEPVSAQIDHMLAEGDFAVITGEFATKMLRTGNVVESGFSIHITVRDGLIVRYRLLEDSHAVVVALQA